MILKKIYNNIMQNNDKTLKGICGKALAFVLAFSMIVSTNSILVCAEAKELAGNDDAVGIDEGHATVSDIFVSNSTSDTDGKPVEVVNVHVGEAVKLSAMLVDEGSAKFASDYKFAEGERILWCPKYDVTKHSYLLAPITNEYDPDEPECNIWLVGNEVTDEPVGIDVEFNANTYLKAGMYRNIGVSGTTYAECEIFVNVLPAETGMEYKEAPSNEGEVCFADNNAEMLRGLRERIKQRSEYPVWINVDKRKVSDIDGSYYRDEEIADMWGDQENTPYDEGDVLFDGVDISFYGGASYSTIERFGSKYDGKYFMYSIEDTISAEKMKEANDKVEELAATEFAPIAAANRETKVTTIAKWMKKNIKTKTGYDTELHSSYGAFINGKASCEGKCYAFYKLCKIMGVPCRVIFTFCKSMHSYCMVQLDDGYWYYVNISSNVKILDEKKFKHAPEQECYQEAEFLYKYNRKIKNTTKDKNRNIIVTEDGKEVLRTDLIMNVYNYLMDKGDKNKEYVITLNKNLKLKGSENNVFYLPGYKVSLDLNKKTLQFSDAMFATYVSLKEIKNGTIKLGKNLAYKIYDEDVAYFIDNAIELVGYDCSSISDGKEFYEHDAYPEYSSNCNKSKISNVKFKASDKYTALVYSEKVIMDSCDVDPKLGIFR